MTVSLLVGQSVDVAINVLDVNGNPDPALFDAGSVTATLSPYDGATASVSTDQTSVTFTPEAAGSYSLTIAGTVAGNPLTAGYESFIVTTPVVTAESIQLVPGIPVDNSVAASSGAPAPVDNGETAPGNNTATVTNPTTGEVITS